MIGDILQPTHLLFILVVALLVLGPKRLPEAGRALGKGIRDFRSAMSGDEDHASAIPPEAPASPPAEAVAPPAVAPPVDPTATQAAENPAQPADHPIQPADHPTEPAEHATEPAEPVHPVG